MTALPQLAGTRLVTDGGLETDLIFHRGFDLPAFAAFVLLDDDAGRAALAAYYDEYAAIARDVGAGLLLESPTWRANPDWGAGLGYDAEALRRIDREAVRFLRDLSHGYAQQGVDPVLVSGMLGPRGDGYVVGSTMTAEQAAEYHRPQLAAFAEAGADLAGACTLTYPAEAVGVVLAPGASDSRSRSPSPSRRTGASPTAPRSPRRSPRWTPPRRPTTSA